MAANAMNNFGISWDSIFQGLIFAVSRCIFCYYPNILGADSVPFSQVHYWTDDLHVGRAVDMSPERCPRANRGFNRGWKRPRNHGSLNVPIFHITQPLGIWSTRWLLFWVMSNIPKSWDIYQPLRNHVFFLGKDGNIWETMGTYEIIWENMGPDGKIYGQIWAYGKPAGTSSGKGGF